MNTIFAISGVVIKELYRRKDFYVLFVVTALLTLLLGGANFFNEDKIVQYLKDIVLLLIWVSALVIAIGTTARQIPAERENRTLFPLLAKPVTRAQVLLGKFTGCWLACGLALAVFYIFFGVITASRESHFAAQIFFQGFFLQWAMLAIVVGLVLLGSIVFTAPSSNATICFVITVGLLLIGGHLDDVSVQQSEPLRTIVYAIYFLVPHLEWYDVRPLIVHGRNGPSWLDCLGVALYAAVYAGIFLFAAWMLFRRKPLNK